MMKLIEVISYTLHTYSIYFFNVLITFGILTQNVRGLGGEDVSRDGG